MLSKRLGLFAGTVTLFIMYLILVLCGPLLITMGIIGQLIAGFAGITSYFIFYNSIFNFVFRNFQQSLWLRKKLLGSEFLEGTWVGHYVRDDKNYFTLEYFEQETGQIKIRGQEYGPDGKQRAEWTSEAASIQNGGTTLVYAYTCDVYERAGSHLGIGRFNLEREVKRNMPHRMTGFAIDTIDGEKDPNTEIKMSDQLENQAKALEFARQQFL